MLLTHEPILSLSPEECSEGRRLHLYEKGEEIPLVSEGVWQVYRGTAQLSQFSDNGEEILLGWAQPMTFFGLWLTHINPYQAKALGEVYLRWYPLSEIENSPRLTQLMLTQVVRRMRQTEALLAIAGLKRVEERLEQLLHLLKQEMGQAEKDGIRLSVRLTHQNLANTIGTTRVTVTRLLGEFQRQGWVSVDEERHLIIRGLA